MIDFRYHLVSIIAVFLALAIGIVLGTTTLREPVIQHVDNVAQQLRDHNRDLRAEVSTLRQQVDADQQLVTQVAPGAVQDMLEGERVVMVQAPGASEATRKETARMLKRAGATMTGRVSVRPKYLEDGEAGVVGKLASRLGSPVAQSDDAPYEQAAAVLARALMAESGDAGNDNDNSDTASDETGSTTILSGFETGGYVRPRGSPGGGATLAVVVAPEATFDGEGAPADNRALAALARALDQRGGGAVVAGSTESTRDGGLIRFLRDESAEGDVTSTVDFADTATGRVVTVFTLVNEEEGESGHYGIGPHAVSRMPTPSSSPGTSEAAGP